MRRILVAGAYGFLGSTLCSVLEAAGHAVFRQGRNSSAQICCDPLDPFALSAAIKNCAPEVLINLIAKTDVDGCELDPGAAFDANVRTVEMIAQVLGTRPGIHLIHVSTDQLYNGPGPHSENHVAPVNVYAITKYAGELVARQIGATTVLRTNFVGRSRIPGRKSLSDWIVGALGDKLPITMFKDVFFSPLHISTVCHCIERVAAMQKPGVYNLGARGGISKAEFAMALARQLGLETQSMVVGYSTDVLLRAKRPLDMTMVVDSFEKVFSIELPLIQDEIRLVARDYGAS